MNLSKPLEAVTERDLDLLVLEEAHSSEPFLQWLAAATFGKDIGVVSLIGAWHSVSDAALGETDLLILFQDHANRRCAILLENKVGAPAQPEQGNRYIKRAESGCSRGDWDDARTVILAPLRYLKRSHDTSTYQVSIAYEALYEWFERHDDRRAEYKRGLIEQAIDQSKRGYTPQIDERVTRFCQEYWLCASREFPELEMSRPRPKPASSTWLGCRPHGMPADRYIWHKMDKGRVDLEIMGAASSVEALSAAYKLLLSSDTEIAKAGKSAAVRIQVPPLDVLADFAGQIDGARAGMRAAYRLVYLSQVIRSA